MIDPKHVGNRARVLAREDLRDRGLVVEEREDRLQEHRLAVAHTRQNGRERPHPVWLEAAINPRLGCGEPAGLRPRRTQPGHGSAALLGEPAFERGSKRIRQLGVGRDRVADVEHVQAQDTIAVLDPFRLPQVGRSADQRLEGSEDVRQPPRRLDRRQRSVDQCKRTFRGCDGVVRLDRHGELV